MGFLANSSLKISRHSIIASVASCSSLVVALEASRPPASEAATIASVSFDNEQIAAGKLFDIAGKSPSLCVGLCYHGEVMAESLSILF